MTIIPPPSSAIPPAVCCVLCSGTSKPVTCRAFARLIVTFHGLLAAPPRFGSQTIPGACVATRREALVPQRRDDAGAAPRKRHAPGRPALSIQTPVGSVPPAPRDDPGGREAGLPALPPPSDQSDWSSFPR